MLPGAYGVVMIIILVSQAHMPIQIANPDLKWEQTTQWNIGVEFGVFNNRLTGEINYYDKFTKGVLHWINQCL